MKRFTKTILLPALMCAGFVCASSSSADAAGLVRLRPARVVAPIVRRTVVAPVRAIATPVRTVLSPVYAVTPVVQVYNPTPVISVRRMPIVRRVSRVLIW